MTVELRLLTNEPVNNFKNTSFKFGVFVDDIQVGVRTFTPLTGKVAKTGCEIYEEHRSKDYSYISMQLMIAKAWKEGFETLITGVHESNKASQTVLFKSGFRVDLITPEENGNMYQVRLEKSWEKDLNKYWWNND